MATLAIESASKNYASAEVLHDINIAIDDGEFLVLVGPSGCGKSTLLNMIAGLESVSRGKICIDDVLVNDLAPKDRDIAMVFQSYALYPTMSVADNIAFGLEMRGVPKVERTKKVRDVAQLLQMEPLLDRKPSQLSGGQRQRVAMGRALVRDPKVFLFDEPLSNLDAKLRVEMRTEIKKLHQRLGTTIVYVTHDQIEAMTMATRIAVLHNGYLQQIGSPQEIYEFPKNTFVASFMGSPSMNLIPATVSAEEPLMLQVGSEATIPLPSKCSTSSLLPGQQVLLGFRPEWFRLEPLNDPNHNWKISATIDVTEPTGPNILALTRIGDTEVTISLPGDHDVQPADLINLYGDLSKAVVFDRENGLAILAGETGETKA